MRVQVGERTYPYLVGGKLVVVTNEPHLPARVLVPRARLEKWLLGFAERHGGSIAVAKGHQLTLTGADQSWAVLTLPFGSNFAGSGQLVDPYPPLWAATEPPETWGILLVRKGGFAIGLLSRDKLIASKVGKRHVQGRSKAGGQSQQRFARRRDNQAKVAYQAAAEHAVRLFGSQPCSIVAGGDRDALAEVLAHPQLKVNPVGARLAVAEPNRKVLDRAVIDAQSCMIEVFNAA